MEPLPSRIDFAAELNAEQLAAVQAGDGPVLIIAAAGTGKTRTLVYRVAYLIEQGTLPARILLLTFTNRAAREMVDRARQLVGPCVNAMTGGTFHSVSNRLLRRHADLLGYRKSYTILDSEDNRKLMRDVLDQMGLNTKEFPKPDVLLSLFSYAVNTEEDVEEVLHERFKHHPAEISDMVQAFDAWSKRKFDMSAMDFDDLLINAIRLLESKPALLEEYQERFQYILVDEYQDTNAIQARFVDMLAAKHKNLLVVGDDFQSIYAWRGADYHNIIEFPDQYEGTQVFKLETNYRSIPEILEVANQCIAGNPQQFQKTLKATRASSAQPIFVRPHDGGQQARYILDRVRGLQRNGMALKDMAVLYRSHFSSMELQLELQREGIPFVITSGIRFFEQAHIKDVTCLLRLIHSPTDELAFMRLVCLLPRVGDRTARKIWGILRGRFNVSDAHSRLELMNALPKASRERWQPVHELLEVVDAEKLGERPFEIVNRFVDEFYDHYALDHFENYHRRIDDLHELGTYTSQFNSVEMFLNEMALLSNTDGKSGEEEEDSLKLSTVHQAKGLEWKVVFVLWLTEGQFPSGRSLEEDPLASEERRLFYVATTRAEDMLWMFAPKSRRQRDGGIQFYNPSRFIGELDPSVYHEDHVGYI